MPYLDSADAPPQLTSALRILEGTQDCGLGPEEIRSRVAEAVEGLNSYADAVRQRDSHLAYLWECSPQLHWIADRDNELVWVSKGWLEVTGRPIREALGRGWRQFVHPDDAEAYFATARQARDTGGSYDLRFRGLTADGSYRWLRTRAVTRRDERGHTEFIYGFTEDVHDQVIAEKALERAVERSALASLATNDLIWDYDFETGRIAWNDAIRDYSDDPAAANADWWEANIHPSDRGATLASFNAFLSGGGGARWQAEYRFGRIDGSYATIFDRGHLLRNREGNPRRMIGAMTDLTARVEAEARIKQLQSELIHVSRLSAMGAMAATLAHELNQPLAAANNWLGVASLLARKAPEVAEQTGNALDQARSSIARAGEIIRRIRSMLWRGNNNREIHGVRELIEESLRLALLGTTAAGVACRIVAQELDVLVDRVQIEQVLLNLVRNAVEAMAGKQRRELLITAQPRDDFVEVAVADTGPGVDAELQARLFTPFITTKERGLGVGLSISRTIIEEHGGTIRVLGNENGGATFIFTLPRARRVAADE